jgi:hypothetical protein
VTRKDFELIAKAIDGLEFSHEETETEGSTRRYVAEVFADALACTNDHFDARRFVTAATRTGLNL